MKEQRIIGSSSALTRALEHASALAQINRPVLIAGERGAGKELFAERIHYLSERWEMPLIKVNCAAMNDSLLDSELFGHEAGAFTGAIKARKGRFERAQGGTLFLDEVGSMSGLLQEKLLRVIEYGELEPVGSSNTIQVDVRVIGASHEALELKVKKGEFRADLLDRLAFDVVHIPALRERIEDIELLAEFFAFRFCQELDWSYFPGFTRSAIETLSQHDWPGNIRELRNTVERSLFHHNNPDRKVDQIRLDPFRSNHEATAPVRKTTLIEDSTEADSTSNIQFEQAVDQFKKELLFQALISNKHNQKLAARSLNLSYDQIRGLVRKYGLPN